MEEAGKKGKHERTTINESDIIFQHFVRRYCWLHRSVVSMLGPGTGQASQRAVRAIRPTGQCKPNESIFFSNLLISLGFAG